MTRLLRVARACFIVAGISAAAMALYHFWLPRMWNWESFAGSLPPAIHWALFSLNFFFSFLLLCGGLATILVGLRWQGRDFSGYVLLFALGVYWLADALYQFRSPIPVPERLSALQTFLQGFALTVSLLYLVPSLLCLRRDWGTRFR